MRIVCRSTGRDVTMDAAVYTVTGNDPDATRLMLTRLLEELTSDALGGPPVLRDAQLARILAYKFKVDE